jgi:glycosyltransferase involved in cell wall biosynthesis
MYDFVSAQKPKDVLKFKTPFFKVKSGVDLFIANSKNVAERINKFYRRDSVIIYPPVDAKRIVEAVKNVKRKEKYFLIVSRLVGAKGLEEAARAFKKHSRYKLKIVGESAGYSEVANRLKKISGGNIELLGRVSDRELYDLYAKAKGFIALARDEDFGMTVVEAQAAGTPVIAFNGGGFKESVIDGKTGILINEVSEKAITEAIKKLEKIKWNKDALQRNAMRFSKESFVRKIRKILNENVNSSK